MKNFGKNLGKRYADIKSNDKKGFTLIELVVVIAIMAILALIMVPNLTAYIGKADEAQLQANLKNVHTAAEVVRQTEEKGLEAEAAATKIANFANVDAAKITIGAKQPTAETVIAKGNFIIYADESLTVVEGSNGKVVKFFNGKIFDDSLAKAK